ncbi:MAG TPA: L-threonylcarbamoyladenylate synthase [Nitrospirales bacterium]|nr:L-threonylcarbamoyladenylate synthase [Nitrospirales bacterium]
MGTTIQSHRIFESLLQEAGEVVRGGGVIAFPTETYYGLGVDPFNVQAVQRLYDLKSRSPQTSPILVLIRSRHELQALVSEITPAAERLMQACWPGPLTLVFRSAVVVPSVLTAGMGTIGVRLSAYPDVPRVLEVIGGPLTGTSANRTGQPPATTAEEVKRAFGADVDLIVNGGPTPGGLPSTVVDTTVSPPRLIREGCVSQAALRAVLPSWTA